MEAFGDSVLASRLLDELDVPSLYYIFYAEKQILPLEIESGLRVVLKEEYAMNNLYVRFNLVSEKQSFSTFFALWKRKRLFSENTPLFFLFEQRKMYSSAKVLYKAAKFRRFDFVDQFLTRKRLWCSYDHIKAVCKGIFSSPFRNDQEKDYSGAWHTEKAKIYYARILDRVNEEDRENIQCGLNRACSKAGWDIGLDSMLGSAFVEDYVYAERWDVVRNLLKKGDLSMTWFAYNKPKFYFYPERIPEDLRSYFTVNELKPKKWTYVTLKVYAYLSKRIDCDHYGIKYQDEEYDFLEEIETQAQFPASKHQYWLAVKRFVLGLDAEKPENDCTYFYSEEQLIWLCKKGQLQDGAAYHDWLYKAIDLAIHGNGEGCYYPELLRCLCKHHWAELKTTTNQDQLLELVKGDQLMEEFISSLSF